MESAHVLMTHLKKFTRDNQAPRSYHRLKSRVAVGGKRLFQPRRCVHALSQNGSGVRRRGDLGNVWANLTTLWFGGVYRHSILAGKLGMFTANQDTQQTKENRHASRLFTLIADCAIDLAWRTLAIVVDSASPPIPPWCLP